MHRGNGQPILMGTLTNAFTPLSKQNAYRINFYLSNESETVFVRVGKKSDYDNGGKGHIVRPTERWNNNRNTDDQGAWTVGVGTTAAFTAEEIF